VATSLAFSSENETVQVQKPLIEKLSQISIILKALNDSLEGQLYVCQTNISEIRTQLAISEAQLMDLTQRLVISKQRIDELEKSNQLSIEELEKLSDLQKKAEQTLASFQVSFKEYKKQTDLKIAQMKGTAIVAGVVGTALGIVIGILIGKNLPISLPTGMFIEK
jgi:chromosome segregation ATPase